MAALHHCLHHIAGFTNRSRRETVATFLGAGCSADQMSCDLWRLRANGLIRRLEGTHTCMLTGEGSASR